MKQKNVVFENADINLIDGENDIVLDVEIDEDDK